MSKEGEFDESPVMAQEVGGIDRLEAAEGREAAMLASMNQQAELDNSEAVAEAAKIEEAETNKKIAATLADLKATMQKNAPDSLDFT